ncbi:hypothetical protein BDR22DRAFT_817222 [Usnea florida]
MNTFVKVLLRSRNAQVDFEDNQRVTKSFQSTRATQTRAQKNLRLKRNWTPFVEKNEGKSKVAVRKVVLIRPIDNRHQAPPVEVEIVYWPWNNHYTFGTMDIGGQRLIVKEDTSTGRWTDAESAKSP